MSFIVLGLSHKTAPLYIREKLVFDDILMTDALKRLRSSAGVSESMILSTCNRTELYCYKEEGVITDLMNWLSSIKSIDRDEIADHIYKYTGENAVRHILRVASGLDSMVLGEPQILGQLKEAYKKATYADTVGKFLNRLMQFSFSSAKLIRSETEIGSSPVSVAYTAAKLAEQIHGDLASKCAILIGSGDTATLVAKHLKSSGLQKLIVANRTLQNARKLATRYNGDAIAISKLPKFLPQGDIIITCTGSAEPILTKSMVSLALNNRNKEPVFIVDLAVPRDVDPETGNVENIYLYTVDDLQSVVLSNLNVRKDAAAIAEEMIYLQAQDYMHWSKSQSATNAIQDYRSYGHDIKNTILNDAIDSMSSGADPKAVIERLANTLTNKLLHHPTVALKTANDNPETLKLAREILGLDQEDKQS
jgi:glutamyl-tRNA reductase